MWLYLNNNSVLTKGIYSTDFADTDYETKCNLQQPQLGGSFCYNDKNSNASGLKNKIVF